MLPTNNSTSKINEENAVNTMLNNYKLGKLTGTCGVGQVWKIYEASRITDGKVVDDDNNNRDMNKIIIKTIKL